MGWVCKLAILAKSTEWDDSISNTCTVTQRSCTLPYYISHTSHTMYHRRSLPLFFHIPVSVVISIASPIRPFLYCFRCVCAPFVESIENTVKVKHCHSALDLPAKWTGSPSPSYKECLIRCVMLIHVSRHFEDFQLPIWFHLQFCVHSIPKALTEYWNYFHFWQIDRCGHRLTVWQFRSRTPSTRQILMPWRKFRRLDWMTFPFEANHCWNSGRKKRDASRCTSDNEQSPRNIASIHGYSCYRHWTNSYRRRIVKSFSIH